MITNPSRRRFLGGAGAVACAGLAGCAALPSSGGGEQAPLIVMHDTVVGAQTTTDTQAPCSLVNQFLRGQRVIFRIEVVDPETGEAMGGDQLNNVAVNIDTGGGANLRAGYGPHPPDNPTDSYWVTPWEIPTDFPPGPVEYGIAVENGRPAKSFTFDVAPSNLTVLEGTYEGGQ